MSERATAGQSLVQMPYGSARVQNNAMEAVEAFQQQQRLGIPKPTFTPPIPTDLVMIRNDSGADRARGDVLQITDKVIDVLTPEHLWFYGSLYSSAVTKPCCVLREPTPEDAIGFAQVSGVCLARVNVTDITHRFANPTAAAGPLTSAATGAVTILSPATGTGVQELAVVLDGPTSAPMPLLEYSVIDIEGWDGSDAYLMPTSPGGSDSAWVGAGYVTTANQALVGIAYDDSVTTPSTDGNWYALANGYYAFTLQGVSPIEFDSFSGANTDITLTDSGGDTSTLNIDWLLKGACPPWLEIELWIKRGSSAIAKFATDDDPAAPQLEDHYRSRIISGNSVAHSLFHHAYEHTWFVYLNAADRVAIKYVFRQSDSFSGSYSAPRWKFYLVDDNKQGRLLVRKVAATAPVWATTV